MKKIRNESTKETEVAAENVGEGAVSPTTLILSLGTTAAVLATKAWQEIGCDKDPALARGIAADTNRYIKKMPMPTGMKALLVGNGQGSGVNPGVARQTLKDNESSFWDEVGDLATLEMAMMMISLGGGTGNGLVYPVAEKFRTAKIPTVIVLANPPQYKGLMGTCQSQFAADTIRELLEGQYTVFLADYDYARTTSFEKEGTPNEGISIEEAEAIVHGLVAQAMGQFFNFLGGGTTLDQNDLDKRALDGPGFARFVSADIDLSDPTKADEVVKKAVTACTGNKLFFLKGYAKFIILYRMGKWTQKHITALGKEVQEFIHLPFGVEQGELEAYKKNYPPEEFDSVVKPELLATKEFPADAPHGRLMMFIATLDPEYLHPAEEVEKSEVPTSTALATKEAAATTPPVSRKPFAPKRVVLSAPTGRQFTVSYRDFNELLAAAMERQPEAQWILSNGQPFSDRLPNGLRGKQVPDEYSGHLPLLNFPMQGRSWAKTVFDSLANVYEVKHILPGGKFSGAFDCIVISAVKEHLNYEGKQLLRYIIKAVGREVTTNQITAAELRKHPTVLEWKRLRDSRWEYALARVLMRDMFGEDVIADLVESVDTEHRLMRIAPIGGLVRAFRRLQKNLVSACRPLQKKWKSLRNRKNGNRQDLRLVVATEPSAGAQPAAPSLAVTEDPETGLEPQLLESPSVSTSEAPVNGAEHVAAGMTDGQVNPNTTEKAEMLAALEPFEAARLLEILEAPVNGAEHHNEQQ